jgi:predicted regulator of Ras-like GTPase activity (Roadblock/LC7/MglB family)
MFKEILKDAVHRTEGGMAALVMGFDGIAVDSYVREDNTLGVEVETVGMEYSVILKEIRKAAQLLDSGTAREVSIQAEKLITVIHMISDEYFVAMAIAPDGNHGKARWLLKMNASKFAAELGG